MELRAGDDLPLRIAFADGWRLWRVGGKDLADSPARTYPAIHFHIVRVTLKFELDP